MLTQQRFDQNSRPNLGASAPHHPYRVAPPRPAPPKPREQPTIEWSIVATGAFLCLWSCARVTYGHLVLATWDSEDTFAILVIAGVGALLLRWLLGRDRHP